MTYSFIANCQTAVVHNNKTKRTDTFLRHVSRYADSLHKRRAVKTITGVLLSRVT